MSKVHEIIGAAAMFYEQGGKWRQQPSDPGNTVDEVIIQFGRGAEFTDQQWAEVRQLFMREVGVGVVHFNDSPSTTREGMIDTLHRISQSAELE